MIHVFLKFCMVLNPTMCQELEISPQDHPPASQIECMRGLMMGNQSEFDYQGARWQIKGGRCQMQVPDSDVGKWVEDQKHK